MEMASAHNSTDFLGSLSALNAASKLADTLMVMPSRPMSISRLSLTSPQA